MEGPGRGAMRTYPGALEWYARLAQSCMEAGADVRIDIYTDIRDGSMEIALGDLTALEKLPSEQLQRLVQMAEHRAYLQTTLYLDKDELLRISAADIIALMKRGGAECAVVQKTECHSHGQYIEIGFPSPVMHPHADRSV